MCVGGSVDIHICACVCVSVCSSNPAFKCRVRACLCLHNQMSQKGNISHAKNMDATQEAGSSISIQSIHSSSQKVKVLAIVALVWLLYAAPLIGFKPFLGSQIANCHQHCVLISAENDENFYKIH